MGDDRPVREDRPTVQSLIEKFGLGEEQRPHLEAFEALLDSRLGPPEDQKPEKGKVWDRTPKGDEYWLLFRARVLLLIRDNLIVSYSTLKQDPWFATNEWQPMDHATKWQRAYDQHLIGNRPPG